MRIVRREIFNQSARRAIIAPADWCSALNGFIIRRSFRLTDTFAFCSGARFQPLLVTEQELAKQRMLRAIEKLVPSVFINPYEPNGVPGVCPPQSA